jgi:hypothetical protein
MIRNKKDTILFITEFEKFAEWDGNKHCFTFKKDGGTVTLMKCQDGTITYHRMTLALCDLKEIIICDVYEYLWNNRKHINKFLKDSLISLNKKRAM